MKKSGGTAATPAAERGLFLLSACVRIVASTKKPPVEVVF